MSVEYRTEPEFVDGEAHPKVSPRLRHGAVRAKLVALLQSSGQRGIIAPDWVE
ncbi:MAG TPA: hypothetical protein VGN11_05510 [Candidatus Baltobacteraceae bacterium]|jgi:hypothetical protein|nr:hypothetical protein [Candidatus Baltobacteraceae bacterium]